MMRRYATMGLAVLFPLAVSVTAVAQGTGGGTTAAASASASTTPAASASAPAAPAASPPPAASGSAAVAASAAPSGSAAPAGSASATAAGIPAPTAAGSTGPAPNGAAYVVGLRELETRVDDLKDQIRRSNARLLNLSETVMGGGVAGSRSEIGFKNEMSSAFRLVRALVLIDGNVQLNRQDETGALSEQKEIPIFAGSMPVGDHTIQVVLNYQGHGFGVLSYLRAYKFEVKASHSFTVTEGKNHVVTILAHEKGGVTTPLDQRPAIDFPARVQALTAAGTQPAAAATAEKK